MTGAIVRLQAVEGVLQYERRSGGPKGDRRLVAVNFGDNAVPVAASLEGEAPVTWRVEVASDGRGEGNVFSGTLGPSQAVLLHLDGGPP